MLHPGGIDTDQFHPAWTGIHKRIALVLDIGLSQVCQLGEVSDCLAWLSGDERVCGGRIW